MDHGNFLNFRRIFFAKTETRGVFVRVSFLESLMCLVVAISIRIFIRVTVAGK